MTKEQPLYMRLYFEPQLTELARIVGYDGVTEEERAKVLPLFEKYGGLKMTDAQRLLLDYDEDAKRYRLKSDVRKLCWQLLGPPPEMAEELLRPPAGALPLTAPAQAPPSLSDGTAVPAPKKRARKKKGARDES
jgi:hypothetical protein